MQVTTTFRHMEVSAPIREYLEEKLARVKKYIDEPIDAQAVLSVEKKIRHCVEVTLVAKGIIIKGTETTNDMYAAIDSAVDKIERQLRRYKERIKRHKPLSGRERQVRKAIVQAESLEEVDAEPVIIRTETFFVKPMSVEEAVMQMDLLEKNFLVFTDADTEELNVVYRRSDGNYGLITSQQKD
ncbi:putative sigma-54 modulation protein [Geothermobacter ehrlichii]|uniref:Ribosome hibernation promoting factor n=1 Tax=Geothermobacter ehrlichii TaxID=213224 RepID=A0A5D3WPW2_9BACT|nr:ribosome-associated translation inhibitor RaiA [Geothermobacter ehrlichii]TYO99510.1 putative sigma-54 modulation protein [Geothermobacter ehrlichii]